MSITITLNGQDILNNLNNNNNNNNSENVIFRDYKDIATSFCERYYNLFNTSKHNELSQMFINNCYITHFGEDILGFNNLLFKLQRLNHNIFTYSNLKIASQPLQNNNILVNITGTVHIRSSLWNQGYSTRFTDTLILQVKDSHVYITNFVFS
jgi:hypothetical protein